MIRKLTSVLAILSVAVLIAGGVTQQADAEHIKMIRVGLAQKAATLTVNPKGDYRINDKFSGAQLGKTEGQVEGWTFEEVKPSTIYILSASELKTVDNTQSLQAIDGNNEIVGLQSAFYTVGGSGNPEATEGIKVSKAGQPVGTYIGPIRLDETIHHEANSIALNTRSYRGGMEVFRGAEGLTLVNELPLEEYLYGVVPAEMPASWPEEALKAQAVAARNYALRQQQSKRFAASGFDVVATDLSQVYKGVGGEHDRTTKAVKDTQGKVIVSGNTLIDSLYHSSSGGFTENSEDVWSFPYPYLKTKLDPQDQNSLHYNWTHPVQGFMTMEDVKNRINSVRKWDFSQVNNLVVEKMTASGHRIQVLRVEGINSQGTAKVEKVYNADQVRTLFGLKSAPSAIVYNNAEDGSVLGVAFKGSGWGHGIGMSQWGARGMATGGYKFEDILKHYYTGVEVRDNYGQ